jgi:hypothetical protein
LKDYTMHISYDHLSRGAWAVYASKFAHTLPDIPAGLVVTPLGADTLAAWNAAVFEMSAQFAALKASPTVLAALGWAAAKKQLESQRQQPLLVQSYDDVSPTEQRAWQATAAWIVEQVSALH